MTIPTNTQTLLSGHVVEWARIEFKPTWDPEASLKTITAFANDLDNWGGGYIVLGIKEKDGIPVKPYIGVPIDKVDAWQKDIYEKCKLICPGYTPIIGKDEKDGKTFLIVWCPGGDTRPYSSPKTMEKNDKERCYYIRKGSVTVIPNDDELKELFALANKTPFDDRVNHTAELSDLNFTLIRAYLKEIHSDLYAEADSMDFETLCADMNLISTLPEYVKPRNVALMFFHPAPEKYFPCAQIDVVQFPDGDGGDNIIEQTFTGPLHEQLRAALRYIRNVVITQRVVKYPDRAEADRFFNYPYAAIEEALSNAVYHKAYDEREPIEVRVEKDMIEIISHPGPDRSVTLEELRHFNVRSRRYRNRRIGEFLKELHLTEGRNIGFTKILNALKQNGSPLPEFETDEAHDYFITRLFIREGFYDYQDSDLERSEKGLEKRPHKGPETKSDEMDARCEAVLQEMIADSKISRSKLAKNLNLTEKQVRTAISRLKAEGRIRFEGSGRGGYWVPQQDDASGV
ncbi:MAG: putative DNA binding domain-containing protein [Clostridia bacterium]|nr:putative DNA binding domain-containing protein [Clostridia bacterium]